MESTLDFSEERKGSWRVLRLAGRVDTLTAKQAEEAVLGALATPGALAIDLAEVAYLSSAGLRVLLRAAKQAKKEASDFALAGVSGMVKDVLEASGMDTLFPVYDAEKDLP